MSAAHNSVRRRLLLGGAAVAGLAAAGAAAGRAGKGRGGLFSEGNINREGNRAFGLSWHTKAMMRRGPKPSLLQRVGTEFIRPYTCSSAFRFHSPLILWSKNRSDSPALHLSIASIKKESSNGGISW